MIDLLILFFVLLGFLSFFISIFLFGLRQDTIRYERREKKK